MWAAVRFDLDRPATLVSGIQGLSLRTNSTLVATVDWAFVSLPVLWFMLLLHSMVLAYRLKCQSRPFAAQFEEETKPGLTRVVEEIRSRQSVLKGCFFVLFFTFVYSVALSITADYAYARDYGAWTLFLLLVLLVPLVMKKEDPISNSTLLVVGIVIVDTCMVSIVFAALLFWFWFFIPSCAASAVLCGARFNPPDFIVYMVLPILLPLMVWKLGLPLRKGQPSPGLGASLWFTLFFTMDYAFYFSSGVTAKSYQAGYSYFVFASESLLAAPFLLLLMLVQYLLGVGIRQVVARTNHSLQEGNIKL